MMRALFPSLLSFLSITTVLLFLSACQQTGPRIETRKDDSVNFSKYRTYALLKSSRAATPDNEIAQHFIHAIREQMDARGYTYSEEKPDLLINYQVNIQNLLKEMGSAEPARVTEGGYYSHSQELYRGMPATQEHTQIFIERKGAARIDIIDAKKRQLIWQGDAQGRLTEEALMRPKEPIRATVADLLREFPQRKK
jgi:hypothetical protein